MVSRSCLSEITLIKVFVLIIFLIFIVAALSTPESLLNPNPNASTNPKNLRGVKNKEILSQVIDSTSTMNIPPMNLRTSTLRNTAPMPHFLYGTAWKKERTEELVDLAVRSGFRGIDTACQPKHYFEAGVGNALERLFSEGALKREDIYLQTKYTPYNGQDPNNIPYDKDSKLEDQVMESYRTSLSNLKTSYLDSLLLHSPLSSIEKTMKVWQTFEEIHRQGGALNIGML
jgi:aryl-alcohol dehydrogenase-like predicted oxidoreductase